LGVVGLVAQEERERTVARAEGERGAPRERSNALFF
jgi:hypothetical protein